MICYFISDQQSTFYTTPIFTQIIQFTHKNPTTCVLKEKETKAGLRLLLTFIRIDSIDKALETLQKMKN